MLRLWLVFPLAAALGCSSSSPSRSSPGPMLPLGATCRASSDCGSGLCAGDIEQPSALPTCVAQCTSDDDCRSMTNGATRCGYAHSRDGTPRSCQKPCSFSYAQSLANYGSMVPQEVCWNGLWTPCDEAESSRRASERSSPPSRRPC